MTGFSHGAVLSIADKIIDAVKSGAIKHFFVVGGCDGARPGRNYYTEFVEQTPGLCDSYCCFFCTKMIFLWKCLWYSTAFGCWSVQRCIGAVQIVCTCKSI